MKTLDKQQEIDFSVCLCKETKLIGKQTIVTEKEFVIPVISPAHCLAQQSVQNILRYIFDVTKPLNAQLSACVFRLQQVSCQSQDKGRGPGVTLLAHTGHSLLFLLAPRHVRHFIFLNHL